MIYCKNLSKSGKGVKVEVRQGVGSILTGNRRRDINKPYQPNSFAPSQRKISPVKYRTPLVIFYCQFMRSGSI